MLASLSVSLAEGAALPASSLGGVGRNCGMMGKVISVDHNRVGVYSFTL